MTTTLIVPLFGVSSGNMQRLIKVEERDGTYLLVEEGSLEFATDSLLELSLIKAVRDPVTLLCGACG
jgi:hypothetical protein